MTKCKSYSLAKNRRSRPARKRQGHQKARKRRPGARNTATKNITGSPAAFDHGPEAAAARIPRDRSAGQKPEGPRSHFHSFHKSRKKARPDRTEQRPNTQKRQKDGSATGPGAKKPMSHNIQGPRPEPPGPQQGSAQKSPKKRKKPLVKQNQKAHNRDRTKETKGQP